MAFPDIAIRPIRVALQERLRKRTAEVKGPDVDVFIVGGGPGGLGAAASILTKAQETHMRAHLTIVDPIGLGGRIGDYDIVANSTAGDVIDGFKSTVLASALQHPSGQRLVDIDAISKDTAATLPEIGRFYRYGLAEAIRDELEPNGVIASKVDRIVREKDGTFTALDRIGRVVVSGRNVVLAAGAHEELMPELTQYGNKVMLSMDVLSRVANQEIEALLHALPFSERKITIVGNSHGAWSAVDRLLKDFGSELPNGGIEVLERKPTKIAFRNVDEARAAGYEPAPGDVCPITGIVNRFGGVLFVAKERALQAIRGEEPRVTTVLIKDLGEETERLTKTTVIVQATGLNANIVPIVDTDGNIIGPMLKQGRVQLTEGANVLDMSGEPLKGVFGSGIGTDAVRPNPCLGGEPNYMGYLQGARIYTTEVGPNIAKQVVPTQETPQPRKRRLFARN